MRQYTVYKITNSITGRAYIGCTGDLRARISAHRWARPEWVDGGFTVEVLAVAQSRGQGGELEARFIAEHGTLKPHGYNLDTGGFKNFKRHPLTVAKALGHTRTRGMKLRAKTEEERAAISARNKAYYQTNPHPNFGNVYGPNRLAAMAEAARGNQNRLGLTHSEETRKKISDAAAAAKEAGVKRKRSPMSEETKERIRAAKTGAKLAPMPEEHKAKIAESQRARHARRKANAVAQTSPRPSSASPTLP